MKMGSFSFDAIYRMTTFKKDKLPKGHVNTPNICYVYMADTNLKMEMHHNTIETRPN